MRILLTNNTLAMRAGTELYVRDLAVELLRRGHQPVAFSTRLGEVADELRQATVPVIDRLEQLGDPPDVIHGQHHLEALMAMLWFSASPAIYMCHGWQPWEEGALRFPSIRRYLAVDDLCKERLVTEGGIPADDVEVILNFFDERRFRPRGPLPARASNALAFGNVFSDSTGLAVLREACAARAIKLDVMGSAGGRVEQQPGEVLRRFDIVFARGRSAIEALAVGAAVIPCGNQRLGPLVTVENFSELRRLNFGLRVLTEPLTVAVVQRQLDSYDAHEAGRVALLTRATCEMQAAVSRLELVYGDVVAAASAKPLDSAHAQLRAAAGYLQELVARHKYDELIRARSELAAELQRLRAELDLRAAGTRAPDGDYASLERRNRALEAELLQVRRSWSWRASQHALHSRIARALFGKVIDAVAARAARGSLD